MLTAWLAWFLLTVLPGAAALHPIAIDYPAGDSIFPQDFAPPTFIWRDSSAAAAWTVEVGQNGKLVVPPIAAAGQRMSVGEIDPRCIGPTNRLPELTAEQAEAHTWLPAPAVWEAIRNSAPGRPLVVEITGYSDGGRSRALSRGRVSILISADPVGAPIFYRDVPLMPSEPEKGVIKPIPPHILPVIAWRLRNVAEPRSRLIMEGLHTCANCHSFSGDGKTLGMDLDGPHNDKGLYAIIPIRPQATIRDDDVISWKSFRGQAGKDKRIGFMSQVSPDGKYVVTATQVEYHVANFKDYRFLQVFYPTRGILAWYNRADGRMRALSGADDPRFVHANAVWSPDGSYLVFARATARDAYPDGSKPAAFANDPNEVQIQYDLYRIPFNGGAGGRAVPVRGASSNGMSNSFPKISPDGKWIVFVQCINGQLMRPDGLLYIVPSSGGEARRMRCNTPLMNSWHSFSPNGRWMVFSSKSGSPYTRMFLTHIDEEGNDSPAILIENATAANRAVNIPEFVNIPPDGLLEIRAPAAEFYKHYYSAWELTQKGQIQEAMAEYTRALELDPEDIKARNNFAALLVRQGRLDEAVAHFEKVLEVNPEFVNVRNNLGLVLLQKGRVDEAIAQLRRCVEINPGSTEAHVNLGNAFLMKGNFREALACWREAIGLEPDRLPPLRNLAWMLATCPDASVRDGSEAIKAAEKAIRATGGKDPELLDVLAAAYAEGGRFAEAAEAAREGLRLALQLGDPALQAALKARLALYEQNKPFHDTR